MMKVFCRRPFSGKWESHQLAFRDPGETERGRGHEHLPTQGILHDSPSKPQPVHIALRFY